MVTVHIFLDILAFVPQNHFKWEGELQGCSPVAGERGRVAGTDKSGWERVCTGLPKCRGQEEQTSCMVFYLP